MIKPQPQEYLIIAFYLMIVTGIYLYGGWPDALIFAGVFGILFLGVCAVFRLVEHADDLIQTTRRLHGATIELHQAVASSRPARKPAPKRRKKT